MATAPSVRNRLLNIRATDSEISALRAAATERRMTMSDLIREAIESRIASTAPSLR
jgi:hypothetical protein